MKKKRGENLDFWKSSSDLLTALILVLLLVIMSLILYILQIPEKEYTDFHQNTQEQSVENGQGDKYDDENKDEDDSEHGHDSGGGGGGGDGGDGNGDDVGTLPGDEEGIKSAVYVTMVDAETQKAVKEAGVNFELYSADKALQILNTYYPKKHAYKKFETTKDGTFYLPEKIYEDSYYLHQLTALEGYDMANKVKFTLDDTYDWDKPYVVKVPMYPARDVIRLQLSDSKDGTIVPNGEFEVIASEDVTTQDGTVRYRKGEVVGKIVCDKKGYGKSKRLYLGKYEVKQSVIPEYYASYEDVLTADLSEPKQKADSEKGTKIHDVKMDRTKITFVLTDELDGSPINGAEFTVSTPSGEEDMTTDESGEIVLDTVEKNSTYEFTQKNSTGDYIPLENPVKVKVSAKGRVGKDAEATVTATNRMIRVDVGIKDFVTRTHVADVTVEMFAKGGKSVGKWTSNGAYTEITDLSPGEYYVTINGKQNKKYKYTVTDTAQIQKCDINTFTTKSYLAIGLIAIAVAGLALVINKILTKRRKKRA